MASAKSTPSRPFSQGKLELLRRLCTAHFLWHCSAVAVAALVLRWLPPRSSLSPTRHLALLRSEASFILVAFAVAVYKVVGRGAALEAALEHFLLQSQAILIVLTWPIQGAVCAWYAVVFGLLQILVPTSEPLLEGDEVALEELTQRNFDTILAEQSPSSALVLVLYSAKFTQCHQHHAILARLAGRYSGPALKWGRLDVSRFPDVAERYGIHASSLGLPVAFCLPALLLFSNGNLVKRIIAHEAQNSWLAALFTSGSSLREASICEQLQLDSWLVQNKQKSSRPIVEQGHVSEEQPSNVSDMD